VPLRHRDVALPPPVNLRTLASSPVPVAALL